MPSRRITKTNYVQDLRRGDYFRFVTGIEEPHKHQEWWLVCPDRFVKLEDGWMIAFLNLPDDYKYAQVEIAKEGDVIHLEVGDRNPPETTEFKQAIGDILEHVQAVIEDNDNDLEESYLKNLTSAMEKVTKVFPIKT